MNNTMKAMCVFGVLASLVACGDDDSDKDTVDSGVVTPIDAGAKDSAVGMDANVVVPTDSGTQNQNNNTTPTKFSDFLNRPAASNVVTVTKAQLGIPSGLLDSNGNVLPL